MHAVNPHPPAPREGAALASTLQSLAHVGLQNLGNTCYMNSGLQCLLSSRNLVSAVLSAASTGRPKNGPMISAFLDLLRASSLNPDCGRTAAVYCPVDIKAAAAAINRAFAGYSQQDAFELIMTVLDGLVRDTNGVQRPVYTEDLGIETLSWEESYRVQKDYFRGRFCSPVIDATYGEYYQRITCPECARTHFVFEFSPCVSLSIPKGLASCSLDELFARNYCVEQEVEDYYCSQCRRRLTGRVVYGILRPPPTLFVQLKRFKVGGLMGIFAKNNSPVSYGATFDVGRYVRRPDAALSPVPQGAPVQRVHDARPRGGGTLESPEGTSTTTNTSDDHSDEHAVGIRTADDRSPFVMQFRACSQHGGSLGGGHYTAIARSIGDGRLYACNDGSVRALKEDATDSGAYVLVFERPLE